MQIPAALAASALTALPNPICQGQQRNIVLTVTNTGEADALNVTGVPALFRSGTGTATLVTSPAVIPVLAGGASVNLTWVYQATSPGSVTYTGTVTGTEG